MLRYNFGESMIAFLASVFGLWFFSAPAWTYILLIVLFVRCKDDDY